MKWGLSFILIYIMTIFLLIIQLFFIRTLKAGTFIFETIVLLISLSAAFIIMIGVNNKKRWSLLVSCIFFLLLFFNYLYLLILFKSPWLTYGSIIAFIGLFVSSYLYLNIPNKKHGVNSLEFLKDTLLSNMKNTKKIRSIRKKR